MKPVVIAIAAGTVACGLGAYAWRQEHRPRILEAYIFSMKSGFSMLIRTPDDKRILIDGGASGDVVQAVTSVLPFYSRRIDAVLATNDDDRYMSGLVDVVSRYSVGQAYLPGVTLQSLGLASSTGQAYAALLREIEARGIAKTDLKAGDSVPLDASTTLDVLFPAKAGSFAYSRASGPQVIFRISCDATSILYFGDASPKIQKFVASSTRESDASTMNGRNGQATVLIVTESATPDNLAAKLMDTFAPSHLVFAKPVKSAGSPKKKPAPDPLATIPAEQRFDIRDGRTIKIVSDGTRLSIGYEEGK